MSEPYTPEQVAEWSTLALREFSAGTSWEVLDRMIATVRAAEAERDRLAYRIHNALAILAGHTCHAGHTDTDHLRLYQDVVNEIERVLDDGGR